MAMEEVEIEEDEEEEEEEEMDEDDEVEIEEDEDEEEAEEVMHEGDVEDLESQYTMNTNDDDVEDDDLKRSKRTKKSEDRVDDHEAGSHEQASAVVRVTTRTAVPNVTVCDADALKCGVCFLTLRPPIFQCEVGHVICYDCREKLEATLNAKCHACGVATRGGYRRCHAMERLVDCIRVPCPYAAHGCDATPPYHGRESHRQVCPHAPCLCPGESCGFIGSKTALLDHFAGAHSWPCTTKISAGEAFSIRLHVGFNFFLLANKNHAGGAHGHQVAATCRVPCQLFLLNVTQERLGRAVSVLCIYPHANGVELEPPSTICKLAFSHFGHLRRMHCHSSEFKVVSTDLSNGLPSPDGCFQFIVPNAVLREEDKDYIEVKVHISSN